LDESVLTLAPFHGLRDPNKDLLLCLHFFFFKKMTKMLNFAQ